MPLKEHNAGQPPDASEGKAELPWSGKEIPEVKVIDKRFWAQGAEGGEPSGPLPELDLKPSYVQELERKMALMEQKFKEKSQDFVEESVRIQQRLQREMERRLEEDKTRLVMDFADLLDTIDLAIAAARQHPTDAELLRGIEIVRDGFRNKLEKLGYSPIGREGEPFDPNLHEAVEVRPSPDPDSDGRVLAVWRQGFRISDRLARPARVTVGRYAPP